MKIRQKLAAALAVLLITLHIIPAAAAQAERLPVRRITARGRAASPGEAAAAPEPGRASASDTTAPSPEKPENPEETAEPDTPVSGEAPMFSASLQSTFQGYVVKGCFTEFPPDISRVRPIYSLDGETWRECGTEWDLQRLDEENPSELKKLQNQICLYSNLEPLKSYLEGTLDRFSLKLRLTLKNGLTYESAEAVIERGGLRPIPDGITLSARFAPSVRILQRRPFRYYGQYQLTVCADAAPEDVSAHLPDTLPVEILLLEGENGASVADTIVDCPVTWKPLSFPRLAAGESVTIADAAEAIIVPGGTLLNTPLGIFRLDEPLAADDEFMTDEVRLIVNAAPKDGNPAGVLSAENYGLEMAFYLKPTGAAAIRAYIWSGSDSEWTELPGLSLLEDIMKPHSGANSSYTVVLRSDQEPYRSYLAAKAAGETPEPFFVGLKIEGGVFDGRQLILAWPDTYEIPAILPEVGGAGGNEGNAGAGNPGDSTEGRQRPDLPPAPGNKGEEEETPGTPQAPGDNEPGDPEETPPKTPQIPDGKEEGGQPDTQPENKGEITQPEDKGEVTQPDTPHVPGDKEETPVSAPPAIESASARRQNGRDRQTAGHAAISLPAGQGPDAPPLPEETPGTPAPAGESAHENRKNRDNEHISPAFEAAETPDTAETSKEPEAFSPFRPPSLSAADEREAEHLSAAIPGGSGALTEPGSRPVQADGAAAAAVLICIVTAAAWAAARRSSGGSASLIRNAFRRFLRK